MKETLETNASVPELWNELLIQEKLTQEARDASKALKAFSFLAKHAGIYADGKAKPALAVCGVALIVLTPYILTKFDQIGLAATFNWVAGGIGWGAFAERKLPVVSGSEKAINKWVGNRILDIKKSKINGGDVGRILVNFPLTKAKGPDEIRGWFERDEKKENKDPYVRVAKSVRAIIFAEEIEEADEEAVKLMLDAQIKVQREFRSHGHKVKEGFRMAANAGAGIVFGVLASMGFNYLWGTQFGGVIGVSDDLILGVGIYRERLGLTKSKISSRLNNLRDRSRKILNRHKS